MPIVKLDLGRYVTVRPRRNGTARVLFEVPARLRPSGWSPQIPLPVTGERKGNLRDADEVARIQADAAKLLTQLHDAKLGGAIEPVDKTMPALIRSWQATQRYRDTKPATQKGYAYHASLIAAWAASQGSPKPVSALRLEAIEQFLGFYDDRPTTRRHLKIVLSMLLDRAIQLEWRATNPLDTIRMAAPKTTVQIWEASDVDHYRTAALAKGQPSIAAMIQTLWEIGQRVTDARLFRHGAEYQAGVFRFYQSKTDSYVTIRVSIECQALIESVRDPASFYLFTDKATGKPWAEQRLGHVFATLRDVEVVGVKGRPLVLRALRHSAVVQMARAGSDVPEVASITGHSPATAAAILARYLPRDSILAAKAQRRRGITGPKRRTKV